MMASPMNLSMVPERDDDLGAQRPEHGVEHAERFGRGVHLGEGGEAAHVGEHHGDLARLAAELELIGIAPRSRLNSSGAT